VTANDTHATRLHRGARAGFAVSTGTVIVTAVALLGAGGAYAYFTHTGSSAPTHATVDGIPVVTTTLVSPTGAVLYPGGPKGGFTITVNPSSHPIRITDIVQDTSRPVVVTNAPGCPATVGTGPTLAPVVTLTAQHNLMLDVNGTPVSKTYAGTVAISAIAPNACQGATFAIPVVLTGRSR
jgi:hypothetical protein